MRRSPLLKAASILMMLSSLVRFFFGIMMINFFATARTFGAADHAMLRGAGIALALLVLGALTELICGFLGALHWEEPLRAKSCAVWGGAALLLGLLGNGAQALTGYGVSCVAWCTGALVPGFFLLACLLFLRAAKKR